MGSKRLTLWVDETNVQDRLGTMVVGVAWEGRCIALAWRSYRANHAAAYPVEGQVGMLEGGLRWLKAGRSDATPVLVLADRGIGSSPAWCPAVDDLGWPDVFRVTGQTKIITVGDTLTIAQQVQPGEIGAGTGTVFKQRGRIPAHARAVWSVGYDQP